MENSRFRVLRPFLVLLCFLVLCLRPIAPDQEMYKGPGPNEDTSANFAKSEEEGDNYTDYKSARLQGTSELCNIDMSTFLPPPYNTISGLVCSPVWNTFILRYHKREENLVTFIISAVYTTGWVGIGFSKDGMMVGSSAMVGWFNKEGHARIKQYYLQGSRPSQVIADAGELELTKIPPAVVLHGPMIYLAFQAKFQKPLTQQRIIFAFGTKYPNHHRLSIHDDKTSVLFDFTKGSAHAEFISPGQMKKNHGILGIFAWGLLLPVGGIFARYMKHKDPLWYYLHAGTQFVGFLFGLANVVLGIQLYAKINARIPAHRSIGIFVLTLSILQILAFFLRPKKDAKIRKYWNWYHGWVGRVALFFGSLNVVLGIHAGSAGVAWKICYGFLVSAILVTVIILETVSWMWKSETRNTSPSFQMNPIS
ncbi:cytochrome b561 and DOMON domain-containing protein At3g61750 [Jatropha curcas]|nr:cytochrome b561 and DOMON domain-containing protein At3g61750 [Jatropha curcas]XP_020538283.1 cytochrome b561 and DOMON domain-containing protein At3g61750 [Jatropha curcas]